MKFVVAGASGFLGQAWTRSLRQQGHDVVQLVRRPAGPGESEWDPYAGLLDQSVIETADVVANLAGAPLAHWPWTSKYQETFTRSRTVTTSLLAERVAQAGPGVVMLAQSGIAGYGDRGSERITEATPIDADTFLAGVVRQWEAATAPAEAAGARVVHLRTSVVLDKSGGALGAMLTPFRLGVGGPLGSGRQYFATITLTDWLAAATYLAMSPQARGAYNLTAPSPVTNREFTKTLGRALHRPTVLAVPSLAIKAALGPVAPEMLNSVRAEPAHLLADGFAFEHDTIEKQITAALA